MLFSQNSCASFLGCRWAAARPRKASSNIRHALALPHSPLQLHRFLDVECTGAEGVSEAYHEIPQHTLMRFVRERLVQPSLVEPREPVGTRTTSKQASDAYRL